MNPDYCIPTGWKWGGGILIPYFPSLSPQYRTPNVCHLYPEYRFLSDFGESRFPSSGQFPYRVKKFGVFPNPACVSSRIPFQTLYIPVYRFLSKSCIRAQILENLSSPEAVKSRILLTFPESCTVFQSNPGAWEYPCRSLIPYMPSDEIVADEVDILSLR